MFPRHLRVSDDISCKCVDISWRIFTKKKSSWTYWCTSERYCQRGGVTNNSVPWMGKQVGPFFAAPWGLFWIRFVRQVSEDVPITWQTSDLRTWSIAVSRPRATVTPATIYGNRFIRPAWLLYVTPARRHPEWPMKEIIFGARDRCNYLPFCLCSFVPYFVFNTQPLVFGGETRSRCRTHDEKRAPLEDSRGGYIVKHV